MQIFDFLLSQDQGDTVMSCYIISIFSTTFIKS